MLTNGGCTRVDAAGGGIGLTGAALVFTGALRTRHVLALLMILAGGGGGVARGGATGKGGFCR